MIESTFNVYTVRWKQDMFRDAFVFFGQGVREHVSARSSLETTYRSRPAGRAPVLLGTSLPSSDVFAAAEASSDHFATKTHYLSLAGEIVGVLQGGSGLALVTGDPPASLQLLSRALSKATESHHTVVGIPYTPELTESELMSAASLVATLSTAGNSTAVLGSSEHASPLVVFDDVDRLSRALRESIVTPRPGIGISGEPEMARDELSPSVVALPTSGGVMGVLEPSKPVSPLFVFGDAHRLSQEQLRTIYEATTHPDGLGAGVLLAHPCFLTRLEEPALRFLKEHLAAQFRFQEIGQDESVEFLFRSKLENRLHSRVWAARGYLAGSGVLLTASMAAFFFVHPVVGDLSERSTTSPSSTHEISASFPTPGKRTSAVPARAMSAAELPAIFPGALPPATMDLPASATQATPPAAVHTFAETLETPQGALPAASSTSMEFLTGERLSPVEIATLLSRGDKFLSTGDIASARLFYERAARGGDGPSALRLGVTFDPAFLSRAGIRGISGDVGQASSWYRRAHELNAAVLQPLFELRQPVEPPPAPR